MKNPAEELVTAWLQECKKFFTMNNIIVPTKKGGRNPEIDILATDDKKRIWVEVSVSTNPRGMRKDVRFQNTVDNFKKDFEREDKKQKAREVFKGKKYEKWIVFGKLPLSKEEKILFDKEMLRHGIKAVHFESVFKELFSLKHYRLDSARGYMNLFKAFQGTS